MENNRHDLIKEADDLASEISSHSTSHRKVVHAQVARAYAIVTGLKRDPEELERFLQQPFWDEVADRPGNDEVEKLVTFYLWKAKTREAQNWTFRCAAALAKASMNKVDAGDSTASDVFRRVDKRENLVVSGDYSDIAQVLAQANAV